MNCEIHKEERRKLHPCITLTKQPPHDNASDLLFFKVEEQLVQIVARFLILAGEPPVENLQWRFILNLKLYEYAEQLFITIKLIPVHIVTLAQRQLVSLYFLLQINLFFVKFLT